MENRGNKGVWECVWGGGGRGGGGQNMTGGRIRLRCQHIQNPSKRLHLEPCMRSIIHSSISLAAVRPLFTTVSQTESKLMC